MTSNEKANSVLIATSLTDSAKEAPAAAAFKAANPDVDIVLARTLDWQKIRSQTSGFRAAYQWVSRAFAGIVAVETDVGAFSRGVYDMTSAMLQRGDREVWGFTAAGKLVKIAAVEETGENDWKANYGRIRSYVAETQEEVVLHDDRDIDGFLKL